MKANTTRIDNAIEAKMTTNAAPPNSQLDFLNCLRSLVTSYPLSSQISNTSLRFLRLRMNATIPDTCAARISKTGAPVAGNKADNTKATRAMFPNSFCSWYVSSHGIGSTNSAVEVPAAIRLEEMGRIRLTWTGLCMP